MVVLPSYHSVRIHHGDTEALRKAEKCVSCGIAFLTRIVVREHHISEGSDPCQTDQTSPRMLRTPRFSPCLRASVVNLKSFERSGPAQERGEHQRANAPWEQPRGMRSVWSSRPSNRPHETPVSPIISRTVVIGDLGTARRQPAEVMFVGVSPKSGFRIRLRSGRSPSENRSRRCGQTIAIRAPALPSVLNTSVE